MAKKRKSTRCKCERVVATRCRNKKGQLKGSCKPKRRKK